MTATLTITLSPEVLKALKAAKDITVEVGSGGGAAPASRAAPARAEAPRARRGRRGKAARAPRAAKGDSGPFRAGSLPIRLLRWAGGRKRPFGVPELMRKLKVKRAHAAMLLKRVMEKGLVKRVGRGAYAAA